MENRAKILRKSGLKNRAKRREVKKSHVIPASKLIQTSRGAASHRQNPSAIPIGLESLKIYDRIRKAIPIIDAAINKIVKLVGSFSVKTDETQAQAGLDKFLRSVKVGNYSEGIDNFISCYFDSMLTYGNAIGEIVISRETHNILALYNTSLDNVKIKEGKTPLDIEYYGYNGYQFEKVRWPQLILFSALNPPPGEFQGESLLRGLPFMSEILLKIYKSIELNFDRVGNVRFAITYNPPKEVKQLASAKDIAETISREWSKAMESEQIRDFIAVGDIDIKVIGADNQIIDTNIPVRQILEQIVAKTGIPPFLLGLSWSTSERMSKQQAEILTSELEGYRRILTPVISKIIRLWLKLNGFRENHLICWNPIHLQDEVEISRAELLNAQAEKLRSERLNI